MERIGKRNMTQYLSHDACNQNPVLLTEKAKSTRLFWMQTWIGEASTTPPAHLEALRRISRDTWREEEMFLSRWRRKNRAWLHYVEVSEQPPLFHLVLRSFESKSSTCSILPNMVLSSLAETFVDIEKTPSKPGRIVLKRLELQGYSILRSYQRNLCRS